MILSFNSWKILLDTLSTLDLALVDPFAHKVLELGLTDSQAQLRSLTDHFCSDSASVAMCENHLQFY